MSNTQNMQPDFPTAYFMYLSHFTERSIFPYTHPCAKGNPHPFPAPEDTHGYPQQHTGIP